jgi:hypothetical protein
MVLYELPESLLKHASQLRGTFGPAAPHRGKRVQASRESLRICFALSKCSTLNTRDERQEHSDKYEEDKQEFLHPS